MCRRVLVRGIALGKRSRRSAGAHGKLVRLLVVVVMVTISCASLQRRSSPGLVQLHGVIRDRDGRGIEGVNVFLDRADDPATPGGATTGIAVATNSHGRYRIGVRPGPYRVMLLGHRTIVASAFLDTIEVTSPITRFDYQYGGIKVTGRVLGPGGRPVASGTVSASGSDSRTRIEAFLESKVKHGHYVLFIPSPGKFYFSSDSLSGGLPGFQGKQIDVAADTTIDFPAEGHRVAGKVMLDSNLPVGGALVAAQGQSNGVPITARAKARSDGSYQLYLPSGGYGLVVLPSSAHRFVAPKFFKCEVTAPMSMDLDMSGIQWTGVVRDSLTGAPVNSITVAAGIGWQSAESVSRSGGRFRLVVQPGFEYSITLWRLGRTAPLKHLPGVRAVSDSTFDLLYRAPE